MNSVDPQGDLFFSLALSQDPRLSPGEKMVLVILHAFRGEAEGISPRECDLARLSARSERNIRAIIRNLSQGGWVTISHRITHGGKVNVYKLSSKAWDLMGRAGAHKNNL